jgi:hypothetical protein
VGPPDQPLKVGVVELDRLDQCPMKAGSEKRALRQSMSWYSATGWEAAG